MFNRPLEDVFSMLRSRGDAGPSASQAVPSGRLHHVTGPSYRGDPPGVADVRQRVSLEQQQIRDVSRLHGAKAVGK